MPIVREEDIAPGDNEKYSTLVFSPGWRIAESELTRLESAPLDDSAFWNEAWWRKHGVRLNRKTVYRFVLWYVDKFHPRLAVHTRTQDGRWDRWAVIVTHRGKKPPRKRRAIPRAYLST